MKFSTAWRLTSVLLFALAADLGHTRPFILDGTVAKKGDEIAHFTVFVRTVTSVDQAGTTHWGRCTGTLIAPRLVLTAAHCVVHNGALVQDAANVEVVFNTFATERLDFYSPGIKADKIVVDQTYFDMEDTRANGVQMYQSGQYRTYDLALIRLPTDAPAGFTPIQKIASQEDIRSNQDHLLVAGYGNEEDGTNGRLKSATVPLRSHPPFSDDEYAYVVIGRGDGATCQGDSGGPILVNHPTRGYLLAGVDSSGDCGNYAFAERVSEYGGFLRAAFTSMDVPFSLAMPALVAPPSHVAVGDSLSPPRTSVAHPRTPPVTNPERRETPPPSAPTSRPTSRWPQLQLH